MLKNTASAAAKSERHSESHFAASSSVEGSFSAFVHQKWRLVFFIKEFLYLLCFIISCITFVWCIQSLRTIVTNREAGKSTILLSETSLAIAREAIALENQTQVCASSSPSSTFFSSSSSLQLTDVCHDLDSLLSQLSRRHNLQKELVTNISLLVQVGRSGALPSSPYFTTSITAYLTAQSIIMNAVRELVSTQSTVTLASHIALVCLLLQGVPVFDHFSVLSNTLLNDWTIATYGRYLGSDTIPATTPNCSVYMSEFNSTPLFALIATGPYLESQPNLNFTQIRPLINITLYKDTIKWVESETSASAERVKRYWESQLALYIKLTILSGIPSVMLLIIVITAPFFLSIVEHNIGESVFKEYREIEGKTKLLARYTQSIITLNESDKLRCFVGDTFLRKISVFIHRIRPYILPTCFGDIEVTTASGGQRSGANDLVSNGNKNSRISSSSSKRRAMGSNFGSNHSTPSEPSLSIGTLAQYGMNDEESNNNFYNTMVENGALDLRLGLGLRPAVGTFLCISTQNAEIGVYRSANVLHSHAITQHLSEVLAIVESLSFKWRGVIHNIAGDMIVVVWNIINACARSEYNALHMALELLRLSLHKECLRGMSMSIASSMVLAGTMDNGVERLPIICGAATTRCEHLLLLNRYLNTSLLLDDSVARRVSHNTQTGVTSSTSGGAKKAFNASSINDNDNDNMMDNDVNDESNAYTKNNKLEFCVVPAIWYNPEREAPMSRLAHAVFLTNMNNSLRAWSTICREIPIMRKAGKTLELLAKMEEYQKKWHSSDSNNDGDNLVSSNNNNNSNYNPKTATAEKNSKANVNAGVVNFWLGLLRSSMQLNDDAQNSIQ